MFDWSIAGWVIAVLIFYTIGFYEGRAKGYKNRKREEAQEQPRNSAAPVQTDDPGVLRIKNEDGKFALDLDGVRADLSALTAAQRSRLIDLLAQMRLWAKEEPSAAPVTLISPPLPLKPAPAPSAAAPSPTIPIKSERAAAAVKSIVEQVDEILQEKIAGTPLEERRIFLSQSLEGGVNVHIGFEKYSGIDGVPDEEVKSVIRAAIKEWEKKYTPGL